MEGAFRTEVTRKSYIWHPDIKFNERQGCWMFQFGIPVIKIKSWIDLPSPQKPDGIQISVIIINWNRPLNVVESCIASVFNQDFPPDNFEVILVDDASDISPKPACLNIVKKYPNHNFRAYLLERTRCWQDSHVFNVGFKRALGWIVVMLHSDGVFDDDPERDLDDSFPHQPALEGTWRHHNARDRLGLCPRMLLMPQENEYSYWSYFPHALGFSIRKKYIEAVHGVNEAQYIAAPILDFYLRLTNSFGIEFTEDMNMQAVHRNYMIPTNLLRTPDMTRPRPPTAPVQDWPSSWGQITEDEENDVIHGGIVL